MSPLRGFPWLLILLSSAAVCAGTTHALTRALTQTANLHSDMTRTCSFFTSFFLQKCKSSTDHTHTHTCACSTGVGGAKVDNASSEVCRHPCEELLVLLTEIHGLRIVTSNLLEDLERVVRQARVLNSLMLLLF